MKKIIINIMLIFIACIILSIAKSGFNFSAMHWKTFFIMVIVYLIYEAIKNFLIKNDKKETK